jgi:hypothetical protein
LGRPSLTARAASQGLYLSSLLAGRLARQINSTIGALPIAGTVPTPALSALAMIPAWLATICSTTTQLMAHARISAFLDTLRGITSPRHAKAPETLLWLLRAQLKEQ